MAGTTREIPACKPQQLVQGKTDDRIVDECVSAVALLAGIVMGIQHDFTLALFAVIVFRTSRV
jgi:hypothetical protein